MTDAPTPREALVAIDSIGGNCPVQAEGFIDGWPFYFRARGQEWSMSIAEPGFDACGEEVWEHREPYGDDPYAAGWMPEDEARAFIDKAVPLFIAWRRQNPAVDGTGRRTALLMRDALAKAWKQIGQVARERMQAEREIVRMRRALGLNVNLDVLAIARCQVSNMEKDGRPEDAPYASIGDIP